MNPTKNKTLSTVFFVIIPLTLFVAPVMIWDTWGYVIGPILFLLYMYAAYTGIGPLVRAAMELQGDEKDDRIDVAIAEHKYKIEQILQTISRERQEALDVEYGKDILRRSGRLFTVLGEDFDKENFPVLYRLHKRNPGALVAQIQSVADAWHEGSIVGAAQALESDLETDSNRVLGENE